MWALKDLRGLDSILRYPSVLRLALSDSLWYLLLDCGLLHRCKRRLFQWNPLLLTSLGFYVSSSLLDLHLRLRYLIGRCRLVLESHRGFNFFETHHPFGLCASRVRVTANATATAAIALRSLIVTFQVSRRPLGCDTPQASIRLKLGNVARFLVPLIASPCRLNSRF